jgi:hypothetical protein
MLDFGWKKKAERLRMVVLSGAHQNAKELPFVLSKMLAIYRRVVVDGGSIGGFPALQQEMERELSPQALAEHADDPKPLWEPIDVRGWTIKATFYLREEKLWWLVHASHNNSRGPTLVDIQILDKVLEHLGAMPSHHEIIGPHSMPADEERMPFGWWTWQNRDQLYDIQINKNKKRDADKLRIVPLGSRETDGYQSMKLDDKNTVEEE